MEERKHHPTAAEQSLQNILKAIDLYWDHVIPLFSDTFDFTTEATDDGEPILKTFKIRRKYDPIYKIDVLKSTIVVPGALPLSMPKNLIEIFVTPEDSEKGNIRVKETNYLTGESQEGEVNVISLPLDNTRLYAEFLGLELSMLTMLVEAGMEFEPDDTYIQEVKDLAYKVLGPDAEELWR